MSLLFETIRIEGGQAFHPSDHQQRIDRSIGPHKIILESYLRTLDLPAIGIFKLRISYTPEGITRHTVTPYVIRPVKTFRLVTDNTIQYDCKWEDRSAIAHLYGMRNGCDDILMIRNGMLTDSSFANIALFDGTQWVTPAKPLLAGTCRARLLRQGILIPKTITLDTLENYNQLMLINAMLDFNPQRSVPLTAQNIL